MRPDLHRGLIRLRIRDVGSDVHTVIFRELRTGLVELEQQHPGVHFHLTGTAVLAARNLNQMIYDLAPMKAASFRKFQTDDPRSRYQAQLGVRYRF